jgi:hypothetical protein
MKMLKYEEIFLNKCHGLVEGLVSIAFVTKWLSNINKWRSCRTLSVRERSSRYAN